MADQGAQLLEVVQQQALIVGGAEGQVQNPRLHLVELQLGRAAAGRGPRPPLPTLKPRWWDYTPSLTVRGPSSPGGFPVPQTELLRFLAHVRADAALRQRVLDALSADEVSRLAQELGYRVSGSDILRFHGQSASGIRISRIDHPGEYPGRYY